MTSLFDRNECNGFGLVACGYVDRTPTWFKGTYLRRYSLEGQYSVKEGQDLEVTREVTSFL